MPIQGSVEILQKGIRFKKCPRCHRRMFLHVWPYWKHLKPENWKELSWRRRITIRIEQFLAWCVSGQTECEVSIEDFEKAGWMRRVS